MLLRYAIVLACLLAVTALQAGEKKGLILAKWKGKVANKELLKKKPAGGVITDEVTRKVLWEAWKVKKKNLDKVDFKKNFMVISTTRGSILKSFAKLSGNGNLKVMAMSSRDLRPGFTYEILLISRDGVKTVNGKKLK